MSVSDQVTVPSNTAVDRVNAFVNTLDVDSGVDALGTVEGAREWLDEASLIDHGPLAESQRLRLIEVREALRSVIGSSQHGDNVDGDALAVLDAAGRSARLAIAFSEDGTADLRPDAAGVDRALGTILAAMYAAMVDGSWSRVKTCMNDECQWAFYDESKNRSAKWCSMQPCGNRMKARAYRTRQGSNK